MTTVQDMLTLYPYEDRHMEAVMDAYAKVGVRVVFALQYADRKGLETIPFWKDTFPPDLHPLLSTAAEPERNLDLLGHFETTRLKAKPRPRVSWALGPSAPERCSTALMQRTHGARAALRHPGLFAHLRVRAAWRCRRGCRCRNTAGC